MRSIKRMLAILLCIMMVVTAFPASVFATETATTETETGAAATPTQVKHAYWDFEDGGTETVSAKGSDLITTNALGFTGGSDTWSVMSDTDGNRYAHVENGTKYIYDTADVLYRETFEASFRVRFGGTSKTTSKVSIFRLLYEKNLDTTYSDRVEFIELLSADKKDDTWYFTTCLTENTSTVTWTDVAIDMSEWYDVTYRLDMETGEMALYIDGVLKISGTIGVVGELIALEASDPTAVNKVSCFEIVRNNSKGIADIDNIHIKPIATVYEKNEVTEYVNLDGGEGTAAVMGYTVEQTGGVSAKIQTQYATLKNGQLYMHPASTTTYTSDAIQITGISSAIGSQPIEVFFDYTSLSTSEYGAYLEFIYNSGSPTPNRRPLYVMSAGNTKVTGEIGFGFGGRNVKNMLFHFPTEETHNIGVRFYPATQTYDFFLDGELVAYTTNVDDVYTLYRPYMGEEPISCSIAVTDTVTADTVNANLKSVFGFEDSNKRWPIVAGEHGTYAKTIELDRYVYNASHFLDNIVVRDVVSKDLYPYELSCACDECALTLGESSFAILDKSVTDTDGVYTNAAKGNSQMLVDLPKSYLENDNLVISGSLTMTLDATADDSLTLAEIARYATDGSVKTVKLGEVGADGTVSFLGKKYAKLTSGTAYTFKITVSAEKQTARLEIKTPTSKTTNNWVVNEFGSFGSKLTLSVPTAAPRSIEIDGVSYEVDAPAVVNVLGLAKTEALAFSLSDLSVACENVVASSGVHTNFNNVIDFEDATAGTLTEDYVASMLADGFSTATTDSKRLWKLWTVAAEQEYVQTAGADTPDDTTDDTYEYQNVGNGNMVIRQTTAGSFPLFTIFDENGILWDQPFEFSFDIYPKTAQADSDGSGGANNTGFISFGYDAKLSNKINLLNMNGDGSTYTRIYRGDGDFETKLIDLYNNQWYTFTIRVYPAEGRVAVWIDGEKANETVLPNVKTQCANNPEAGGIAIGWNYGQTFDFDLDNIVLRSISENTPINEHIDFEDAVIEAIPGSITVDSLLTYLDANDGTMTAALAADTTASYYTLTEDKGNWVMGQSVPTTETGKAGFSFKDATNLTSEDTLEITFDFKKLSDYLCKGSAYNTVRFTGGTTMSPLTFRTGTYISTGAQGYAVFRKTDDGFVQAMLDKDKWYSFKVDADLSGTAFKLWMKEGDSVLVKNSLEWEPLYFITNGTADGVALDYTATTSEKGCLLAETAAANTYALADYEALMTTEGDMAWYNNGSASFGATPELHFLYGAANAFKNAATEAYMDNLKIKTGDGNLDLALDFTPANITIVPETPATGDSWWWYDGFKNDDAKKGGTKLTDFQVVDAPAEAETYGKVIQPKTYYGAFCFNDTENVLPGYVFDVSYDFYMTSPPSSNIHMLKLWAPYTAADPGDATLSTLILWSTGELMVFDTTVSGSNRKSADVKTYLSSNTWYNIRVRFDLVQGYYMAYVNDRLIHVQDISEVYPDLDISLLKDLHFEIHNHWGADAKGYHYLDNIKIQSVDEALVSFDGIRLLGVQQHNSSNAIRVIAGVTSLNYGNVGFTFEMLSEDGTGWRKVDDRMTNTVYTQIVADGETVTAAEMGCVYFVMAVITDVHSEGTLCIRPYTTRDCVRDYGDEGIYAAYINDGGLFLEPTSIALSDAGYTLYKHETFETARDVFQNYGSDYSETNTNEYKYGGQLNAGEAVAGSSTASARSGEKSMYVSPLGPEGGVEGKFGGRIKLNNLLPYDMSAYEGKILKLSAYVRATDFVTPSEAITMSLGIMGDKNTTQAGLKTFTVSEGEWTHLEYEVRITSDILATVGEGYPTRVFIGFGSGTKYPTTVYVDDIKVSFKDSVGLTLPSIFADGMVVQRDTPVAVWGWDGLAGDEITAELGGKSASATVDANGEFYMEIPALEGASGQTLTINNVTAGTNVSYSNVGIGEVLYCSGQSNMQLSVKAVHNNEELKANADKLDVRSFKMSISAAYTPQKDVKNGSWTQITSSNVTGRSAIAYTTASQLQAKLGVPVAIIECFNGGSAASAWLSYENVFAADRAELYNDKAGLPTVAEFGGSDQGVGDGLTRSNNGLEGRTIYEDYAFYWDIGGANEGTLQACLYGGYANRFAPTGMYNGMQYPLKNYAVGAVLWYQGESRLNSMQPEQYNYILHDLIEQWRTDFRNDELPVVIFQLAPYSSYYNEIRQTQLDTAKRDEHVYAITTATEGAIYSTATGSVCLDLDRSTKDDGTQSGGNAIHPGSKIPVATRAANTLLSNEYGLSSEYASLLNPEYQSMSVSGNVVTLTFSDANGLKVRDGDTALEGFRALDASGTELTVVSAVINGDTVVVTTEEGTSPTTVTYGWWVSSTRREVNYPNIELNGTAYETQYINVMEGNLESAVGQPAIPFYASVSDVSIYDASVADGKLNVEVRELGHLCSTYKVVVDINGTPTEYTATFTTAGNFVISDVTVTAGDSVTVTLKTVDGATVETKTVTVE